MWFVSVSGLMRTVYTGHRVRRVLQRAHRVSGRVSSAAHAFLPWTSFLPMPELFSRSSQKRDVDGAA